MDGKEALRKKNVSFPDSIVELDKKRMGLWIAFEYLSAVAVTGSHCIWLNLYYAFLSDKLLIVQDQRKVVSFLQMGTILFYN